MNTKPTPQEVVNRLITAEMRQDITHRERQEMRTTRMRLQIALRASNAYSITQNYHDGLQWLKIWGQQ